MSNKLIIAAAGSGKTTYLVKQALSLPKENKVLITTYTEANEAEIRSQIIEEKKCIPSNITVQTWFSFLLQHGVRPFQGSMNDILWDNSIRGMLLSGGKSGKKLDLNGKHLFIGGHPQYWGEGEFRKHYFSTKWNIYSDKISKFIVKCDKETSGAIISRLSRIYSSIFIDEIQDLAGYYLDFIKLLFKYSSNILLVGDPRQVTYLTHIERKYDKYKEGLIKEFLENELGKKIIYTVDEKSLKKSHRNNKMICDFASKLYTGIYEVSEPCDCKKCRSLEIEHQGIFIVRTKDIDTYLDKYSPIQLRWNSNNKKVNLNYKAFNFGESKGQSHDRVLIYPTDNMVKWIIDNSYDFTKIIKGKKRKYKVLEKNFMLQ